MNAAAIISLIALVGPSIEAGQKLYQHIADMIAQARAEGIIDEAQQKELWDKLEAYRTAATSNNYPAHWQQQPENN